ncbi:VIT domain-containing protein, partial [Armatimonas sp.]|uniref:VIT domain-containing protein n=1 Tax=Armatimonas sp. TaxID=1872638 RepID=UPI0037521AA1
MKTTTSIAALLGVSLAAGGATLLRSRAQAPTLPTQIPSNSVLFPELGPISAMPAAPAVPQETPGCLRIENTNALCPLRHTDVKAHISGMVARVTVTQLFEGPRDGGAVEAIYTFPLPENAAVDDMTIKIGKEGVIKGTIKRRDEARQIYNAARAAGQTAALLDQERDNIFTQSIANLLPGEQVAVQISYVMPLKYEDGHYEFVHPLVVGPRYGGVADNQPLGVRSGHDVSVSVNLDAGLALGELAAQLHAV